MEPDPVTVPAAISLAELAEGYVLRNHFQTFPVVREGTLIGCINSRIIRQVPRAEWKDRTVGEMSTACSGEETIAQSVDAMRALAKMTRTGRDQLMVVDGDRLVGVVTLGNLLRFLSLRLRVRRGFPSS